MTEHYRQLCNIATLQSREDGFFKNYAGAVMESEAGVFDGFSDAKSDMDRFLYCWSIPASHSIILIRAAYKSKDVVTAAQKRGEAVTVAAKNFEAALALFNQSIIRDICDSSHYSSTLQSRSKALLEMGRPDLALLDAQASLKGSDQKPFVYSLIGDCYLALGPALSNKKKAEVSYKIGEKLANDLEENRKAKAKTLLSTKLMTIEKRFFATETLIPSKPSASVSRGESKEHPGTFKEFKVKTSKELGRYAATDVDLEAGDTLLTELPFAAVLNVEKYGSYCHHCQERLVAAFCCPWCRGVGFCSEKCRNNAKSYHVYECHLTDLMYASGMSPLSALAMRIVTQRDLEHFRVIENVKPLDAAKAQCSYLNIQNLVGHENLRDTGDIFMRTMMAVFILKMLRFSGYFDEKKPTSPVENEESARGVPDLSEEELLIGRVLLRNLHVLQFNAHEICDLALLNDKGLRNAKSQGVGLAIYQSASLFNHSCYPNVARYFVGNQLVIRSLRRIPAGSPLLDNYGPLFTHMDMIGRKKITNARYWFDCQCDACVFDWPTYKNMPVETSCSRFRCSRCASLLPRRKIDGEHFVTCTKCKNDDDTGKKIEAISSANKFIDDATSKMDRRDSAAAIESLLKAIKILELEVLPPSRNLHLAQDNLRLCYSALGSTWKVDTPKK